MYRMISSIVILCTATAAQAYDGVTPEGAQRFQLLNSIAHAVDTCPGLVWNDGALERARVEGKALWKRYPALSKQTTDKPGLSADQCEEFAADHVQWVHFRTDAELDKIAADARAEAERVEAARKEAAIIEDEKRRAARARMDQHRLGKEERILAAGVPTELVEKAYVMCQLDPDVTACARRWYEDRRKLKPSAIENFLKSLDGVDVEPVPQLVQSEADALRSQVQRCWNVPAGALGPVPKVTVAFELDRTGALTGSPRVVAGGGSTGVERASAEAARRAVSRCSPYDLPPERYEAWKHVAVTLDPLEMF